MRLLVRYLTEDQERREEFVRTTVLEKVRHSQAGTASTLRSTEGKLAEPLLLST